MLAIVKKIRDILTSVLTAIIVVFALVFVISRAFGIQIYTVISGSMEPQYHVGSVIFVKPTDPYEIAVDDVITFKLTDNVIATHRVVRIDTENESFYTKGDNNEYEDIVPVGFSELVGSPIFTLPLVGYVVVFLKSPLGISIIALVIIINICFNKKQREE